MTKLYSTEIKNFLSKINWVFQTELLQLISKCLLMFVCEKE